MKLLSLAISCVLLSSCAAMFVPKTSDPIKKLQWATWLYDKETRPLPAERLIRQAISICQAKNDHACLGKAYVTYGFFFRSPSLVQWRNFYREHGFLDSDATMNNRYQVSKDYFKKGVDQYLKAKQYDALPNAYLNLAFAYIFLHEPQKSCEPYSKALQYYRKNKARNPELKVYLPRGAKSFPEFISKEVTKADCK